MTQENDPDAITVGNVYADLKDRYSKISPQRLFLDNTLGVLIDLFSYVPPAAPKRSPLDFHYLDPVDSDLPDVHAISIGLISKHLLSPSFVSNELFDSETTNLIRDAGVKGLEVFSKSPITVFATKASEVLSVLKCAYSRTTGEILRANTPTGVRERNPDPTERALPTFGAIMAGRRNKP